MSTPNYELLKTAYAIIDGIPSERINLDTIRRNVNSGNSRDAFHCGTIGCAIGWLALHPDFQALGLMPNLGASMKDADGRLMYGWAYAAQALFGITSDDAKDLFGPRTRREEALGFTHKEAFQRRVKGFLLGRGQL